MPTVHWHEMGPEAWRLSIGIHWWAKTLWPLTDEANNLDYLVTTVHLKVCYTLGGKWTLGSCTQHFGCARNGQAWRPEWLWHGPNGYSQTTESEHLRKGKACGVPLDGSGEYLPTVVWGGTNHKPVTGCWVLKGHQCARVTNAILSDLDQKKELLWHKLQTF